MNKFVLLFSIVVVTVCCIACNSNEFLHEHSLTLVNQSDYEIEVRLYQRDSSRTNFPISIDSFTLQSYSEVTFYEKIWRTDAFEDLLCAPLDLDSSKFTTANNLQLKKNIMDYRNWMEISEGSKKNVKVQNCRFIIENEDLE